MKSSKTLSFPTIALRRSFLVAFALASLALTGCSSQIQAYCEAKAECRGGNDKDIDACVAENEGAQDAASAYDCSEPYDKLADCIESKGKCENGNYGADCGPEYVALSACQSGASTEDDKSSGGSSGE